MTKGQMDTALNLDPTSRAGCFLKSTFQPSRVFLMSAVTQGAARTRAAGYCPKILPLKRQKWCSVPSIGVIGKSALEIGQFLRRNFWMISGGPFLSRLLCFTADDLTWMQLFGVQLEASCLQWIFLLTVDYSSFFAYNLAFLLAVGVILLTVGAFCLQWESASKKDLRDCKPRSLTASKKAPTVTCK